LVKAIQKPETESGSVGDEIELPLDQMIHRKWNAPQFSQRGNSMVTPAFESIELLRDYRRAQRAIAKRWTTPLRFILVGGKYGDKVIMPTQKMISTIRDQINKMDLKSGLVVPFYVRAETYGTEGQVLNTEDKVKEVKEDIIVALGIAKSLVTGDGPNPRFREGRPRHRLHRLPEACPHESGEWSLCSKRSSRLHVRSLTGSLTTGKK
jgi:hypothetical protein